MSRNTNGYQGNWVKYRPQDLKVIERIWKETTGKEFRYDPHKPLDELVSIQTRDITFAQPAKEANMDVRVFIHSEMFYMTKSGHAIPIPKEMRALFLLAYFRAGCKFSVKDGSFYVPPLNN